MGTILPLGLLSLAQLWLLPGAVVLTLLARSRSGPTRPTCRGVEALIAAFGLSWVVNFWLVWLLTACGLYTRTTLLLVVAAELALLATVHRNWRPSPDAWGRRRDEVRALHAAAPVATSVLLPLALVALAIALTYPLRTAGEVFVRHDAVVSWNRWALDWADGQLPQRSWRYPQLLPAAWSITYVLPAAPDVPFFSRLSMCLFVAASVAMPLDLALRRTSPAWLAAAPLTYFALDSYGADFLTSGYAEAAVACFSMLPVYLVIGGAPASPRRLLVAAAIAGGAALTKQGGWYVLAALPVIAAVHAAPGVRARAALLGLTALLVALPWYGYKEWAIRTGRDASVFGLVLAANPSTEVGERLVRAERLAVHHLLPGTWADGPPTPAQRVALGGLAALTLLGLARREQRWGALLVGLPAGAVWACALSYDMRNASPALPHLAASLGAGAAVAGNALSVRRRRLWLPPLPLTRVLVVALGGAWIAVAAGLEFALPGVSITRPERYLGRVVLGFALVCLLVGSRDAWPAVLGRLAAWTPPLPGARSLAALALLALALAAAVPDDRLRAAAVEARLRDPASNIETINRAMHARADRIDGFVLTTHERLPWQPAYTGRAAYFVPHTPETFFEHLERTRWMLIDDWSIGGGPTRHLAHPSIREEVARWQLVEQLPGYKLFRRP